VLTAHANVDPLGWKIFVEQPKAEVLAPLNASIQRIAFLLLGGLDPLGAGRAVPRARARAADPHAAGRRRADRRRQARPPDRHPHRRRARDARRAVQPDDRQPARVLRGLERKVDERTHELSNSLEQQTAITEILRVISSSPTDVKPVLDVVAERAALLCEADVLARAADRGDRCDPIAAFQDGAPATASSPTTTLDAAPRSVGARRSSARTIHHRDVVPLLDRVPGARAERSGSGCRPCSPCR
jgi:hypothetical protein